MFSFFFKHSRLMISVVMVCVVISMMFYGAGGKSIPQGMEQKKVVYKVGSKDIVRKVTKDQLEAMKTYINYDLGYGFNDVLERQNIFSNGFFMELISSVLGKEITSYYFDLVKDDFEDRMNAHKRHRLYKHWSGKLSLESKLEVYASDLYGALKKVQDRERGVDVTLLHDMIDLSQCQMEFTPHRMKGMMRVLIRDNQLGADTMLERKNFALFQAKNNEDLFGDAFIELFAQVMLEGAAYARDHNFYVSYEEAEGVIMRRAQDFIEKRFTAAEEHEERRQILSKQERGLGLSRKDLVKSAQAVMIFQKMLKNVENSVFLDKMSLLKLFKSHVETLFVKKVTSNKNLMIASVQDALELNCYLSSLGELKHPLIAPEELYEEEEMLKKAPHLCTEAYVVKVAACSERRLASDLSLQKVWAFQTSDEGWKAMQEKFSFEAKDTRDERFDFLQALSKAKKDEVDLFSRKEVVKGRIDMIEKNLDRQDLKKETFYYNDQVKSKIFPKGFDEKQFISDLSSLKEGDKLDCYTQDNELYFKIILVKKPEKRTMLMFEEAKKSGCLKKMVESQLATFINNDQLEGAFKEKMLIKMLTSRTSKELAEGILKSESEKKVFFVHQQQILDAHKEGLVSPSEEKYLEQFNLNIVPQRIARSGEDKKYANTEFFTLKIGENSVYKFDNRQMYYVQLKKRHIDERMLRLLSKKIHDGVSREAQVSLYEQLSSHIEENKMLELSRFKKGA